MKKNYFSKRLKAFVIDLFMIYTPILYVATYGVLGGKEAFQSNQIAIFICVCLYGIIDSIFCSLASQTPGMRAYNLILITNHNERVSFVRCLTRFMVWILSLGFVFGFIFPFLRRDRLNFHDFVCQTRVLENKVKDQNSRG